MASEVVWRPYGEYAERSNVKAFMERLGIDRYEDLRRRSAEDPEWYWDAVSKHFRIEWFEPYSKVLDVSQGIQWAKWFVGGKVNLAHNCVDKHVNTPKRNQLALVWEGEDSSVRTLTYRDLFTETNRLANGLKKLGLRKGDRVGLFLPMIPEAVIATLACAKVGAVFTPIFSGFGPQPVATRLSDCEARVLITADGFLRRGKTINMKSVADEAVKSCPTIERVVVFRRLGIDVQWYGERDLWWSELIKDQPARCETEKTSSEDAFMIVYTSGTTGKPKGSVHVHGGFLVQTVDEIALTTDLRDGDMIFWFTDMGWIMGPWEAIGATAMGGVVLLYEGAPDYPHPGRVWSLVERHDVNILGISPTVIRTLMAYGEEPVRSHDLSTLRVLASTGEPWNRDAWMWYFEKVGGRRCPIINVSGGTEIGTFLLSPVPLSLLKPCTLYGPCPGIDADVFGEDGRPVRGQVGELVVKKPWPGMTRGIWKDPKRYIETYWSRWEGIWVHGDWASIDEDGLWFLHGRSDDTIKLAGKRIGPAEVEQAALAHPGVLEAAAIGLPDPLKGESLGCFLVLKPGCAPSEELRNEVRELVSKNLGKALRPELVKFVRILPKTKNGKIMRRLVRAVVLGKEVGDLSSLETPDALEEIKRAV